MFPGSSPRQGRPAGELTGVGSDSDANKGGCAGFMTKLHTANAPRHRLPSDAGPAIAIRLHFEMGET
jgi:hypothetical protein